MNNYKLDPCGPVNIIIGELWGLLECVLSASALSCSQHCPEIKIGSYSLLCLVALLQCGDSSVSRS